jgi:penicillin V acylase-like amidase (Ntn superfamily)
MTNSPVYDEQLALNKYWQGIGGTTMLPGTNRAADRFVRALFYIDAVTKTADSREAVAAAFSVIRNVSVPLGITTPDQPNIASTLWRTAADHKNRRYYFESARDPNVFWVDLEEINFKAGATVKRLLLTGDEIYAGNVAKQFNTAEPFAFLCATV